ELADVHVDFEPEQQTLDVKISAAEAFRAPKLPIPRVRELVWKQAGLEQSLARFDQGSRRDAVVTALVMLLPEAHHVVAQGEQEVILAIVMGLEKGQRLTHQPLIAFNQFWRDVEEGRAVGGDIEFVSNWAIRRQLKYPHVRTRLNGGIDKQIERQRNKRDRVPGHVVDGKRCTEFPVLGKLQGRAESKGRSREARRVEQHFAPHED